MRSSGLKQFASAAREVGLNLDHGELERLRTGAELLAATARVRGISQYKQVDEALIRAMAPALAFFRFHDWRSAQRIADLGAGNGALGATIALCAPDIDVALIDRATRSITACELLTRRMGLQNAECLQIDVDSDSETGYDGVVFRALAQPERALTLARGLCGRDGFVGAWHAPGDPAYDRPPMGLEVVNTVRTVLPDLVLTGYRL